MYTPTYQVYAEANSSCEVQDKVGAWCDALNDTRTSNEPSLQPRDAYQIDMSAERHLYGQIDRGIHSTIFTHIRHPSLSKHHS